jgi:hypothetical protein
MLGSCCSAAASSPDTPSSLSEADVGSAARSAAATSAWDAAPDSPRASAADGSGTAEEGCAWMPSLRWERSLSPLCTLGAPCASPLAAAAPAEAAR